MRSRVLEKQTDLRLRLRKAEEEAMPGRLDVNALKDMDVDAHETYMRSCSIRPGTKVNYTARVFSPISWNKRMVFDHMHDEFGDLLVAVGGPVQTSVANMNVFAWQATIMKDISSHEREYEARANAKMAKMLLACDEYPKELTTMYLSEEKGDSPKPNAPKPKGKGDDPMDGTKR